jgi:hypothetical protein
MATKNDFDLSVQDAAALAGCSVQNIYQAVARPVTSPAHLRSKRVGRAVLISTSGFAEWQARRKPRGRKRAD